MKARLPKTTKISGTKWRVVTKRTVRHEDGEECEGLCHFDHHLIEVSVSSEDEFTILCNFWHELCHGIIHESGVDLDDNTEHAIIKQFEKFLATNVDWREHQRRPKKLATVDTMPASEPKAKHVVKRK